MYSCHDRSLKSIQLTLLDPTQVLWKKVHPIGAENGCQLISKLAAKMAATLELRPRMQKWAKIIKGVTPPVGSLLTPQSYFCPHRLMCPGALSCSPQFLEGQLSGVDSSDAKMPKDEHSSDPGCGVTFDRASWQPFYAPIGGTFFHSTWSYSNKFWRLRHLMTKFYPLS